MANRNTQNMVGSRGESICYTLLTKFVPNRGFLFQPQFLGEKWPRTDFIVKQLETGNTKPFFFVQVKTTQAGYESIENRLKVQIKRENIIGLVAYPAPTYLVGIDEPDGKGFIVSVNGESIQGHSTLTT